MHAEIHLSTLITKRVLDLLIAVPLTLVLAPLLAAIAIAIRLGSPGPALFVQERLGRDCRPFRMYKFRTMVANAERMGTGLFSFNDDPRITRLGKLLRSTSLDELPQLFNVIAGSMSLVGPRPPVTYELGPIEAFNEATRSRFRVKPGITGLAQVTGRNDLDWPGKIQHDNQYIELLGRRGVAQDVLILARTAVVVIGMRGIIEPKREA